MQMTQLLSSTQHCPTSIDATLTSATMNPPHSNGAPSSSPFPSHGQREEDAQATAAAALSQHNGIPGVITLKDGRKRKATSAPGSRGVANLTAEQLAKKRANDREAQRAIRERTKSTIEGLERRIKELESQQPFQELQRVMRERDQAVQEVLDLRDRLSQVAQVVGGAPANATAPGNGGAVAGGEYQAATYPHHHQHPGVPTGSRNLNGTFTFDDLIDPSWLTSEAGNTDLAALTAQQNPLPPLGHHQQQQQHPHPHHHAQHEQQYCNQLPGHHEVHSELRSPSAPYPTTRGSPASSTATAGPPSYAGTLRRWSPGMEHRLSNGHGQAHQYSPQANGVLHDQRPPSVPLQGQHNGERHGLNFLLGSTSQGAPDGQPRQATTGAYSSPERQHQSPHTPAYALLPNNCGTTNPLDALLGDFIANQRKQLHNGASIYEVLGPDYPSFAILADANSPERATSHPISAMLVDILSKFPDISGLSERVATLYIMFLVIRWCICPRENCYERMPEWIRPVTEQITRPHAMWMEHLPWYGTDPFSEFMNSGDDAKEHDLAPAAQYILEMLTCGDDRPGMRKTLAISPMDFDDFFVPYTTTLSLNWNYDEPVLLTSQDTHNGDKSTPIVTINPVFEKHMRDISNWSLGSEFRSTFPDLCEEGMRIEDRV